MNRRDLRRALHCVLRIALLVIPDQLTKYLAVTRLKKHGPVTVIRNLVYLIYTENEGAALGILEGHQVLFTILAIVVVAYVIVSCVRMPEERCYRIMNMLQVMIGAGAIGNMLDRIRLGYVIDFIYIRLPRISGPVFNVADIFITVGCALLIILALTEFGCDADYADDEDEADESDGGTDKL